jgi:O-antigen ligase
MHQLFFYTLLALLPTQLGYHFWPEWALVLGRRVDYLSPTLFVTDTLIILLLFFWFIGCILRIKNYELGIKKLILNRNSLFLILFVFVNIWFSVNKIVALYTWLKFFEFFLLGLYIVKTKPDVRRVICFLTFGVIYSSLLAITQFILQHSIGGLLWALGERTFFPTTPGIAQIPLCLWGTGSCPLYLRAYATFPHPNVLGGFLAAVLPLLVWKLMTGNKRKFKIFYGISVLLGVIALILSFSRSAWIAGLLGISISYCIACRPKKLYIFAILFLTVSIGAYVFLSVHPDSESAVVREQLVTAAISVWKTSPVTGVGLGNFLIALPRYIPSRAIYFLQPVHNIYLLVLSETGIIGLAGILFFIWMAIKKKPGKFCLSYLSLSALLILGLIDHYPLSLQQGRLLLTLFIALSLA